MAQQSKTFVDISGDDKKEPKEEPLAVHPIGGVWVSPEECLEGGTNVIG